jgi:hypothetical protein
MITKGDRYREISAVLARHGIRLVEDEFIKHEAGDQAPAEHLRRACEELGTMFIKLGRNITITPEILKLIAEIDEFKGRWKVMESLAPEKLTSWRRIATIESVGSSSRIEGAKLSDREVEELLSGVKAKSFASRDEQEVAGYADAMDMVFESFESVMVTENHIKQLHGVLLKYSRKDQEHRVHYKQVPNHVEAFGPDGKSLGVVFETATPFETPSWMKALVNWFNESVSEETQHPLILIGIFIVVFLAIHPFKDGNGRISRVLTTLLLLRVGYGYVPYSSMESVIEATRTITASHCGVPSRPSVKASRTGILAGVFSQDDGQAEKQPCRKGQRGASPAFVLAGAFSSDTGTGKDARGNHGQRNRGIDWYEPQHHQTAFAKAGQRQLPGANRQGPRRTIHTQIDG